MRCKRPAQLALAITVSLLCASTAEAGVVGYNEPAYTKTSGNNAFWYRWNAINGVDSDGNTRYEYYLCLNTYVNGVQQEFSNGTNGPGSQNCTGTLRNGPSPSFGDLAFQPFAANTVLPDGALVELCASGWRANVFVWSSDGASTCPVTRIDRNLPTAQVQVGGGQAFTRDPSLVFRTLYSDATSPAWPATYRCIKVGSACSGADQYVYDANCSVASQSGYVCTGDASQQPDGPIFFCARVADSAIPDNPSSVDQFKKPGGAAVTSSDANISAPACDSITLDRTPPTMEVSADDTDVDVGQLVTFGSSAGDATSGVKPGTTWSWGDNTADGSGDAPTHTYTQAGTFVVTAEVQDNAGNEATRQLTMTVTQPASTTPTTPTETTPTTPTETTPTTPTETTPTTTSPTTTTTPSGTTQTGTTPIQTTPAPTTPNETQPTATTPSGGGSTTPAGGSGGTPAAPAPSSGGGASTATPGGGSGGTASSPPAGAAAGSSTGGSLTGPTSVREIVREVGGSTQSSTVGGLDVLAPKKVALVRKGRRVRTMPIALSPDTAGVASVALVRGARVLARATATFRGAGTYGLRLRLPKGLRAGAHQLRVSFTPTGASVASTKTLRLTLTAPKRKAGRRARAGSAGGGLSRGARVGVRPAPGPHRAITIGR